MDAKLVHDKERDVVFLLDNLGQHRVNWDSIDDARLAITAWAAKTFPKRTSYSALCKLTLAEIPEFLLDQDSPGEFADLLILIFDIASLRGINIPKALEDKMKINLGRKWNWDRERGIAQHVETNDE